LGAELELIGILVLVRLGLHTIRLLSKIVGPGDAAEQAHVLADVVLAPLRLPGTSCVQGRVAFCKHHTKEQTIGLIN